MVKLFLDSANLEEIEEALKRGFLAGLTTNPSIMAKEKNIEPTSHIHKIIELLHKYNTEISLSIELLTTDQHAMMAQAEDFLNEFEGYDNLYIKVPIGWDELKVIRFIHDIGGNVNCTCAMSVNQALIAAAAGVSYVSIFWGRIRDIGYDAATVVRQIHRVFAERQCSTEIIVGSIRQMIDINEAVIAGADVVTVPYKFLPLMCQHPKTTEAVAQFMSDFTTRADA